MPERETVVDYLADEEELQRKELVWGMVREPAAPLWGHQAIVTRATVVLYSHVRQHHLGQVCASPIDVVLDEGKALVLQPDIIFVSHARAGIVRQQVWGAPDLVVEVESPGTRRRDRVWKRRWYRSYGVREYWLIDPIGQTVTVMAFPEAGRARQRAFRGKQRVHSAVLPAFDQPAATFFE